MPVARRQALVNPRLGIYASIVAGVLASLVLVLLIVEELGGGQAGVGLGTWLGLGILALFAAIALATLSSSAHDYFVAGRRVPAGFNGLVLGMSLFGGTGAVALTGALFLGGFDVLAIPVGFATGLVLMAVLLAPFYRKLGATTLPSFLATRFQSPLLGTVMACLLVVPLILLLSAELRVGAEAAALLFGRPVAHTATLLAITIMIVVGASGLRSQTWSGVAMAIAALLAFIVPIAIVATMETFLPIPQLSHGPVLRALGRTEALQTLPQIQLPPLSMTLPGQDLSILSGRFASQTTMLGTLAFALLSLIVAFGVAGSPSLLPRCGAAPSVYDSRKSLGWAAVVLIIMVTTMSAVAVLTRDLVLKQAIGSNPAALASWLRDWIGLGLAQVDASGERVDVTRLAFRRDGILYLLPHAHGLPHVVVAVAVAGAVAASLLAACQAAVALSSILVDDIMFGSRLAAGNETRRLLMARASLGLATLAALAVVANVQVDPLQLVLWSLCLSAATAFPVMVLSVWWKNLTGRGAMSGALAGFSVTALAMLLAEGGVLALASPLSALLGTPITFAVAIAVSLLAHGPGRAELEIIRDVRVPGGETFVDREVRQERARGRKT